VPRVSRASSPTRAPRSKEAVLTLTRPERFKLVAVLAWLGGPTLVILGAVLLASPEQVGAVPWVAIVTGLAISAAVSVRLTAPASTTPAVISGVLAIAGVVVVWTHRVSSHFGAA
jgi:hypothetical protein